MLTVEEKQPLSPHFSNVGAPEYEPGTYGEWALKEKPEDSNERGYFNDFDHEPPGYYIVRDNHVWMSTSRLERESHAIHVKHATGTVVVCGVGMGMYLYNIAGLERVERIVAIDLDPATIDLVQKATGFETWPGKDKIRFVNKDALKLTPADIGPGPVDYLYVDIWPELGNPQAIVETQAIQSVVNARTVGWWGQELDFIEWLYTHWPKQKEPTLPDLVDFMESIAMPIEEHSSDYILACGRAGAVYASYGATPSARARRKRR
jgi:hypothetical protein